MKHTLRTTIVLAGLAATLAAQTETKTTEPIDYEARVKSVATLKEYIAQREAQFQTHKTDLQALDARIEERIDYLVKTLLSIKDSPDSRTKVANIKGEVIDGLRRTITIYRQKRMEIFERQRKEQTVPEQELAANIDVFDKRIGKRIEQIMELVKSLPGYEEVPKYESTGTTSYANGWYEETSRVSDEWRQNRRQTHKTDTERRAVLDDLEKAINTADSRRRSLTEALKGNLSERDRKLREEELGRTDALLTNLRQRRREVALPGDGGGREIGMSEASDLRNMIEDSAADLRRDFNDLFRKLDYLDDERTKLRGLENNLKAREEWLKNNPPPAN
ncbi:MAG: hypothetical protein MUF04_11585, partial [Akkermansiaceae bacterium]|jgi:Skp family chaperone for outer membrane proteins|nr:hypothetical protein [Akkermansiaceae bacterium]